MERMRILLSATVVLAAFSLLPINPVPASAFGVSGSSAVSARSSEPFEQVSHVLSVLAQRKGTRPVIWPAYPPAPGEEWQQVEPYVWHFYKRHDATAHTEKWYTMGREGLQWKLDNLILPKIEQLREKQITEPDNPEHQQRLDYYEGQRKRILTDLNSVGSYYDSPNPDSVTEQPEACNYATTSTSIDTQIRASGQACASGSSASTSASFSIWRNYTNERGENNGTTWASIGVSRAKIPGPACSADAWASAYWGPFWWDRQDSDESSYDSDCQ